MVAHISSWESRKGIGGVSLTMLVLICAVSIGIAVLLLFVNPLIVIAGLIGLVVMAVAFRDPYRGVLLCLMLEYVRPGELLPALEALHLNRLLVIVTATGWLINRSRTRSRLVWTGESWAVFGLTGVIILSVVTSVWPGRSIGFAMDGMKTAFMFLLISNLLTDRKRVQGFIWTLVLLAVYLSGDAVLSYVRTGNPARGAAGGFLGDENDLALALLVILPFAGALFQVSTESRRRLTAAVSFSLIVWGVIFTFSRGAFLGLVSVLFTTAAVSRKRWTALGIFALVILILWLAAPAQYHTRIATISQYQQDESAKGRTLAWGSAIRMFKDRPFFGVGAGDFEVAYGLYYKPPGALAIWRAAHSVYFQCLGELGGFGIFFFTMMVILTLRDLFRLRAVAAKSKDQRWMYAVATGTAIGMIAYLVSGTFLSALYYPHPYLMAALTASLVTMSRVEAQKQGRSS